MSESQRRSVLISLVIIFCALALTFLPLPGLKQHITVVAGSELQQILPILSQRFQQSHPGITVELKFEGSQDIVNKFIDRRFDYTPTVLIPADAAHLNELRSRWQAQNPGEAFYSQPRPLAKTLLVAIAWPERGKVLFPQGQFSWQQIEQVLDTGNWSRVGGPANWGSFDLLLTDPTRSNSAQQGLYLWATTKLGTPPDQNQLSQPPLSNLFAMVKRSVYQPPRSTDILLQEFIARGVNDADVALVYESIALSRWQSSQTSQGQPYQIYYLNPTLENTSTAAIVREQVDANMAAAATQFIDYLSQTPQQEVFVQYGFRPAAVNLALRQVASSPWRQNIPGSQVQLQGKVLPAPSSQVLDEIARQWNRAN
jgi:ABC-type molybdate transport system substrate-binding protein